jgi:hypothetical protein
VARKLSIRNGLQELTKVKVESEPSIRQEHTRLSDVVQGLQPAIEQGGSEAEFTWLHQSKAERIEGHGRNHSLNGIL